MLFKIRFIKEEMNPGCCAGSTLKVVDNVEIDFPGNIVLFQTVYKKLREVYPTLRMLTIDKHIFYDRWITSGAILTTDGISTVINDHRTGRNLVCGDSIFLYGHL